MEAKEHFGSLTDGDLQVGDIVEWSNWNKKKGDWISKYGIILEITSELKANRLISVSKVVPIEEPSIEKRFFTFSLRLVSRTVGEET